MREERYCQYCGEKIPAPKHSNKKFCCLEHYQKFHNENDEKNNFKVPDAKIFIRIVFGIEEYCFRNLQKAINFLSTFSTCDPEECLELIEERKNKIGHWQIFYN